MGKGDKKTRRGKIGIGTFGRLRPRKKSKTVNSSTVTSKAKSATKPKAATKKPAKNTVEEEE